MINKKILLPLQELLNESLQDDVRLVLIEKDEKHLRAAKVEENWNQCIASSIGAALLNDTKNEYKLTLDDKVYLGDLYLYGKNIMTYLWPKVKDTDSFRLEITKTLTGKKRSYIFMRA